MERYTVEQRVYIVKTFENASFVMNKFRRIRDFSVHRSSRCENSSKPSSENIAAVRDSVTENQKISIPRRSQWASPKAHDKF